MNDTVCLDIKALYKEYGKFLTIGEIVKEYQECNDTTYYDLLNEFGKVACMDGEEVFITEISNGLVHFQNDNGEYTVYFALTEDESDVAIVDKNWRKNYEYNTGTNFN